MIGVKHTSASSINKFVECPAHWAFAYDDDLKINTRSEWTDAGVIVHGALEKWRDPKAPCPQTFEELERCYREVCGELQLAESLSVFKRGLDLIRKAFEIDSTNKHVPMNLAQTMCVEFEIKDYYGVPEGQPPKWSRPFVGFLDRIAIIRKPDGSNKIIVIFEDYKTGRVKSWSELIEDDVQPSGYLAYGKDIYVPWLRTQIDPVTGKPYDVERIVLLWSYIDHGVSMPIQETDIELEEFVDYIGNVTVQMVNFKEQYENIVADLENAFELDNKELIATTQGKLSALMSKFERVNDHCSWCPRKRVCTQFNRQMEQEIVVDLQTVDMDKFLTDRARYASIAKAAEDARKTMDAQFNAYLDKGGLTEIIAGGRVWKSNTRKADYHAPTVVASLLGDAFVLNSAKITKEAVEAELGRRAAFDPEGTAKIREELEKRIIPGFGGRTVTSSKLPASKKGA